MHTNYESLMESLAIHLGLPTDRSWNGPVDLRVDDLAVTLEPRQSDSVTEIWMHVSLAVVPEERELEMYRALLAGNMFWCGTADATIGVNSQTREAKIARRLPLDGLDGQQLAATLARLVQVAKAWRNYLTSEPAADDLDSAGQLPPEFSSGMIRA